MCECLGWIDVIIFTFIVVFFQILMYKIGFSQGQNEEKRKF